MLRGDPYDKTADIFSFGIMLWELATEQSPDLVKQVRGSIKGSYLVQLAELLKAGHRLQLQSDAQAGARKDCFPAFYCQLVEGCMGECKDRPSFAQLMMELQSAVSHD